jgi:hypothetical protein
MAGRLSTGFRRVAEFSRSLRGAVFEFAVKALAKIGMANGG